MGETFLQLPGAGRGPLADQQSLELLPRPPAYPRAAPHRRPAHVLEQLDFGLLLQPAQEIKECTHRVHTKPGFGNALSRFWRHEFLQPHLLPPLPPNILIGNPETQKSGEYERVEMALHYLSLCLDEHCGRADKA